MGQIYAVIREKAQLIAGVIRTVSKIWVVPNDPADAFQTWPGPYFYHSWPLAFSSH